MKRISSGNPVLDRILMGGFPDQSIHIVMGEPGTGKTILAQQLAFCRSSDRPALYLTTVSEPLPKLVTYIQEYGFADPADIGTRVIYESLADPVIERPERLVESLTELIREHRPAVIVIDSFKALGELVPDRATWRRTLYDLAGMLTAYDAATFWVGEYTAGMISELPEFGVADGIVELSRHPSGSSDDRYLRVLKLRGSDFLPGYHFFRIDRSGLEVFVRLVTPPTPEEYTPRAERVASGIDGLDQMIDAGWLRGTSTIVLGPSGAGKTALGLHFLRQGVASGEPGLLVAFQESPPQLARILDAWGWPPDGLLGPGRLDVLYTSPVELQIDSIVTEVFRRVEAGGIRRLVIDAIGDLERSARDLSRYRDYLYTLNQYMAARGVTTMLLLETSDRDERGGYSGREISPMSDNLLLLGMHLDGDLRRTIRILKSRGSAHDGARHTLRVTAQGLAVTRGHNP